MKYLLTLFLLLQTHSLLAQSETEALLFLQKHHPGIYAQVLALKTLDRADYDNVLADAAKAATDFGRIEQSGDQPTASAFLKMYALDFEAVSLSDQLVAATDETQRKMLLEKLRGIIAASFDQWEIVERARIKRLESELTRVKAELEYAVKNRMTVIEEDTAALIEESRAYQGRKNEKN